MQILCAPLAAPSLVTPAPSIYHSSQKPLLPTAPVHPTQNRLCLQPHLCSPQVPAQPCTPAPRCPTPHIPVMPTGPQCWQLWELPWLTRPESSCTREAVGPDLWPWGAEVAPGGEDVFHFAQHRGGPEAPEGLPEPCTVPGWLSSPTPLCMLGWVTPACHIG